MGACVSYSSSSLACTPPGSGGRAWSDSNPSLHSHPTAPAYNTDSSYKVNLFDDWYRKTNFALATAAASITGIVLLGFIQQYHEDLWKECRRAFDPVLLAAAEDGGAVEAAPQEPVGPSAGALGASKDNNFELNPPWWKAVIAGAGMLLAIIAVELIISWNNIQEVNTILTTGQLIPFVIGVGGLMRICLRWWQLEKVKKIADIKSGGGAGPVDEKNVVGPVAVEE